MQILTFISGFVCGCGVALIVGFKWAFKMDERYQERRAQEIREQWAEHRQDFEGKR